jgi:hypothetical protein
MDKEFVPYELALALKDIGYQSANPIGGYRGGAVFYYDKGSELFYDGLPMYSSSYHDGQIIAPLYQQAFDWFREEYDMASFVQRFEGDVFDYEINSDIFTEETDFGDGYFDTYEEARLACIKKLIQIVKQKQDEKSI